MYEQGLWRPWWYLQSEAWPGARAQAVSIQRCICKASERGQRSLEPGCTPLGALRGAGALGESQSLGVDRAQGKADSEQRQSWALAATSVPVPVPLWNGSGPSPEGNKIK